MTAKIIEFQAYKQMGKIMSPTEYLQLIESAIDFNNRQFMAAFKLCDIVGILRRARELSLRGEK